jgi:D-alanyl-D-alanine carboxypeptidase (penicillin-binding protein 5/6)
VQKLLITATVLPRLDPKQVVTVTGEDLDIEPGSSAVGLVSGGSYSIETLWLGLLLVSGNDAANVLARLGGGADGVAGTMKAANELAHELGARDTHAVTPHGLDAPGQFTSAYDLALIARLCLERDDFRRYATTPNTKIPAQPPRDPRGFQIQNDNSLIANYPGALGGKTGFTDAARHTYVGAAERDGRRLVVTLLNGEAVPNRSWQQAAALLDWGFGLRKGSKVGRLVEPGELDSGASADQKPVTGDETSQRGGEAPSSPLRQLTLVAAVMTVPLFAAAIVAVSLRNQSRAARRRSRRRSVSSHKGTHP